MGGRQVVAGQRIQCDIDVELAVCVVHRQIADGALPAAACVGGERQRARTGHRGPAGILRIHRLAFGEGLVAQLKLDARRLCEAVCIHPAILVAPGLVDLNAGRGHPVGEHIDVIRVEDRADQLVAARHILLHAIVVLVSVGILRRQAIQRHAPVVGAGQRPLCGLSA